MSKLAERSLGTTRSFSGLNMDGGSFSLPPDVEREIFETAALLYPGTIPRLLRVARRVLIWKVTTQNPASNADMFYRIEPLLYNTIQISIFESQSGSGAEMLRRIETKGASFFSTAVRHVEITAFEWAFWGVRSKNVWSDEDLKRVLRACTGVQHLFLVGDLERLHLAMLAESRPTRVDLLVDLMHPGLHFAQPMFQNLTHLLLGNFNRRTALGDPMDPDFRHWPAIFRLPALTHLALAQAARPSLVHTMLADAPRLAVLVIFVEDAPGAAVLAEQLVHHDERLVFLALNDLEGSEMNTISRLVDKLWTQADEFVSRKHRGLIEGQSSLSTPIPSLLTHIQWPIII